MSATANELRQAVRSLRRSPGFSGAAIVTLGVCIAAATIIFSILHAVVIAPLPYREADRLMVVWEVMEDGRLWRPAPASFGAWKEHAHSFEGLAAFGGATWTLTGDGDPISLQGARVTPDYFSVLGVSPALGRTFDSGDARAGAAPVILLGHDLWVSRFGADPSVLGRLLTLGSTTYAVIGVMPAAPFPAAALTVGKLGFSPGEPSFFVPAALQGAGAPGGRSYVLGVVGRLKPGVTAAAAQQEMSALARRLRTEDASSRAVDARLRPLTLETEGATRPALWLLFGAVGFLLAIGCANVASLELARAEARAHEFAVRASLGAARGRIAAQVLIDAGLVAAGGGALGSLLSIWGLPALVGLMPADVPRLSQARLHPGILAFAVAVSVAAGLASGSLPALVAARRLSARNLAASARGATGSRAARRWFSTLVLAEIAAAVLLASGAILLTRSFLELSRVDPGFRATAVTVAQVSLPRTRYADSARVGRFQEALLTRVRGLPGVQAAALAYNHPLEAQWIGGGQPEAADLPPGREPAPAWFRSVSDGYFHTVGVPIVTGRDFAANDDLSHPGVAIVNQSFVRANYPDGRALGRWIEATDGRSWWGDGLPQRFEIVGVVGDVRFLGLDKEAAPAYYLTARQFPIEDMHVLVRGPEAAVILPALRQAIRELDPALPIQGIETLARLRDAALAPSRLNMRLMLAFGAVAVGLATLGCYGLLSYVVALRRREIGIRLALGARAPQVVAAVVGSTAKLAAAGIALGLAAMLALAPLLARILYGVAATDASSLAAAAMTLFAVTLVASGLPARRAARIAPSEVLKGE